MNADRFLMGQGPPASQLPAPDVPDEFGEEPESVPAPVNDKKRSMDSNEEEKKEVGKEMQMVID